MSTFYIAEVDSAIDSITSLLVVDVYKLFNRYVIYPLDNLVIREYVKEM
jgi:hypothetical protein